MAKSNLRRKPANEDAIVAKLFGLSTVFFVATVLAKLTLDIMVALGGSWDDMTALAMGLAAVIYISVPTLTLLGLTALGRTVYLKCRPKDTEAQ